MSLINQMLKDLDGRREETVRGRLHREVRPLPAAASPGHGRWLVPAVVVVFVALLGGWFYQQQSMVPVASAPVATPVAAPVPAPAPIYTVPEPSAATVPGPAAEDARVSVDDESGMKLSAVLDQLPSSVAESKAPVAAKMPIAASPQVSPAVAAPSPKPAPAPVVATPPAITTKPEAPVKLSPGTVEKQVPQARSGRERAEQDYQRALALVNGARVPEAIELLLHGLQQDGGHTAARQLLARLLIEQRNYDEAAAILAEGIAAQPAQIGWAMSLARLQVEKNNLDGAAQTLQRSLPHALSNADYLGFFGLVQYRLQRPRESAELYRKAAQQSPAEGRWWLGLGLALEAGNQAADARDAFLRARAAGTLTPDLQALVDQKLR